MNWKTMIASHWKLTILLLQLGLLALRIALGQVLAEPIDNPGTP